jgi:hypothetical protein
LVQELRAVIAKATGKQPPEPLPDPPIAAYGEVMLHESAPVADNLQQLHVGAKPFEAESPVTMAQYGMAFGVMEYWCDALLRRSFCSALNVQAGPAALCRASALRRHAQQHGQSAGQAVARKCIPWPRSVAILVRLCTSRCACAGRT